MSSKATLTKWENNHVKAPTCPLKRDRYLTRSSEQTSLILWIKSCIAMFSIKFSLLASSLRTSTLQSNKEILKKNKTTPHYIYNPFLNAYIPIFIYVKRFPYKCTNPIERSTQNTTLFYSTSLSWIRANTIVFTCGIPETVSMVWTTFWSEYEHLSQSFTTRKVRACHLSFSLGTLEENNKRIPKKFQPDISLGNPKTSFLLLSIHMSSTHRKPNMNFSKTKINQIWILN